MGTNLDSLMAWARSLLPATPAPANSTERAKANWAATSKPDQRALALLFFGVGPLAQPVARQPTETNSHRGSTFIEVRVQAVRLNLRPRPAVRLTLAL